MSLTVFLSFLFQGYGIAMSLPSFKPLIDSAILHVQESGALHKLNVKWWKQKRGGGWLLPLTFPGDGPGSWGGGGELRILAAYLKFWVSFGLFRVLFKQILKDSFMPMENSQQIIPPYKNSC